MLIAETRVHSRESKLSPSYLRLIVNFSCFVDKVKIVAPVFMWSFAALRLTIKYQKCVKATNEAVRLLFTIDTLLEICSQLLPTFFGIGDRNKLAIPAKKH